MDDIVKLLDSISRLIAAAALPIAVFAVFWLFRLQVRNLIDRTKSASVEGPGGFKASISTEQAEAAGAIAAAVVKSKEEGDDPKETARDAKAAASIVTSAVTPEVVRQATDATILWVDDRPDNNIFERQAMEALGVRFVLAKSTEEGIDRARSQAFDVIISDMSRGMDRTAGFALLEQLREAGIQTPFLIYAARTNPEQRAEAMSRGALDATNRPDELFQRVLWILRRRG